MIMDDLIVDKLTPILIYGAAGNGMRGYHSLCSLNGYNVIGFIDTRANEIKEQYGLPVYKPADKINIEKKTCVVCLCIKNVFEHELIVSQLIQSGYCYFIFKPIYLLKNGNEESIKNINTNYEKIFGDDAEQYYKLDAIPELQKLSIFDFSDHAVLEENKDSVVALMPFEEIFFENIKDCDPLTGKYKIDNITTLASHIGLFLLFNNDGGSTELYMQYCVDSIKNSRSRYGSGGHIQDTAAWRTNILRTRRMVNDNMNELLERDYSFFVKNAPICSMNEEKRLVMKSSKHRVSFFIAKKRKYIPVRISKEDYARLFPTTDINLLRAYLEDNKIYSLKIPINHPVFYGFPTKIPTYYVDVVYPVIYEICTMYNLHEGNAPYRICDAINDSGTIARCMSKAGFYATAVIENQELQFCKLLDRVLQVALVEYSNSAVKSDILFVEDKNLELVRQVSPFVVFVITKEENITLGDRYSRKKTLLNTIWEDQPVFMYMFERCL